MMKIGHLFRYLTVHTFTVLELTTVLPAATSNNLIISLEFENWTGPLAIVMVPFANAPRNSSAVECDIFPFWNKRLVSQISPSWFQGCRGLFVSIFGNLKTSRTSH